LVLVEPITLRSAHNPLRLAFGGRAVTRFIGIDPGLTGALALLEVANGDTTLVDVIDVPVVGSGAKQCVDVILLQEWLLRHGPRHAFLERAQAMPKQGASSGFKYGRTVGALEAVIAVSNIAITMVEPSKWKRHFHLQGGDKEGARGLVIRLFPGEHRFFARKKDHGRAEAVLVGLYGMQTSLQLSTPIATTPVTEMVA
jgi:crossover junction endodeoxyribonuclease RuvC